MTTRPRRVPVHQARSIGAQETRSPNSSAADPPIPEGTRVDYLTDDLVLLSFPLVPPALPETLTSAEQETARLVYEGLRNEAIARVRGVSVKTVGNQLESIYRKLNVASRVELVLRLRDSTDDSADPSASHET